MSRTPKTWRSALAPALILAAAAAFAATLAVTGAVGSPWDWGTSATQASTITLDGASFGPGALTPSIPAPGGAAAPLVSFQGRLIDPGTSLPVADAPPQPLYSIIFTIYDGGGNKKWTETQPVSTLGGLFNVMLGSVKPLSATVFDSTSRYLGVQVGADPEMTPRLQFGYVPYAFQAEQAGSVSRPGSSFTRVDSAGTVGQYSSIAIGTDGLPVISYYDVTNGDLKVAHCGNIACSAGNTITMVDGSAPALVGDVGTNTSITIGADGLPVISYRDVTHGHVEVAHCGDAACSTACGVGGTVCTTVDNSSDDTGLFNTSITIGAGALNPPSPSPGSPSSPGFPVISYYAVVNATHAYLKVAHCGNFACTSSTPVQMDNAGGTTIVGSYSSITIAADGVPIISYYDNDNNNLKVAHCGDYLCSTACGAGGTVCTAVDTTVVGTNTSIAIGRDRMPVISYHEVTTLNNNIGLKVAHCSSYDCTGAATITILSTNDVTGWWSSIAIGSDDLPIISSLDGAGADASVDFLMILHCGTAACTPTASNQARALDALGTGETTSLTIGSDGLPVISYWETSTGSLKVAHCSNVFCVPNHRPR